MVLRCFCFDCTVMVAWLWFCVRKLGPFQVNSKINSERVSTYAAAFFFFVWTLAGWAKLSPDWEVEGTRVETALSTQLDAAVAQRHHGRVVAILWQNFGKFSANFRSFSAVSTAIFASKYAFCSIFFFFNIYQII